MLAARAVVLVPLAACSWAPMARDTANSVLFVPAKGPAGAETQAATPPVIAAPWLDRSTIRRATIGPGKYLIEVVVDKAAKIKVGTDDKEIRGFASLVVGVVPVDAANNATAVGFVEVHAVQQQRFAHGSADGTYRGHLSGDAVSDTRLFAVAVKAKVTVDAGEQPEALYVATTGAEMLSGDDLGWGNSVGRLSYGFLGGAIVSNDANEFDFSEVNLYLRLMADTTLEERLGTSTRPADGALDWDGDDVHITLDTQLTAVPVEAKTSPTTNDTFLSSKKAFVGTLGLDWRPVQWRSPDGYDLTFGPSAIAGFETYTERLTDEERFANRQSVNEFWGMGVRFAGLAPNDADRNPLPRHYGSFYYGEHDSFAAKRFMLDAGLILGESGFYIGVTANLGKGDDDMRLVLGFASNPSRIFDSLARLIPPGLREE